LPDTALTAPPVPQPPTDARTVDSPAQEALPPSASPLSDALPALIGGYRIEGEIARGGVGIVLRAHDDRFQRSLAVKLLQEKYQDNAAVAQRFLEEAQVMGQLQHPGIPPVYDLGELPDGRPFFALKLIKGRTLAELLHERPHPAHDLARWVALFGQVCQTVAYAHSRGILHRDLKPSNIMVGAFGEVQVMDWGLAKVLGSPAAADAAIQTEELSTIATVRTAEEELATQDGAVLGTPAFMAPEQARGEIERLDERADVFGLGAILCVLLTGKPPYVASSKAEVYRQAKEAVLTDAYARLEACGADDELVRLAKTCLRPDLAERPRQAGLVAEAVAAYQTRVQERLRAAEVTQAQAQVQLAEERKRRRLAWVLAAAVLVLVAGGAAAALWYQQQQATHQLQVTRAEAAIASALDEADNLAARADTLTEQLPAWRATLDAAWSALQRAEALRAQEPEAATAESRQRLVQLRARLEADQKDLQLLAVFDQVRLDQSQWHVTEHRFKVRESYPPLQKALADYGLAIGGLERGQAAARLRQRPPAVQKQLLALLEECRLWAPPEAVGERRWLAAVLTAEDDLWMGQFRQAVAQGKWAQVERLVNQVDVSRYHPAVLVGLSRALTAKAPGSQVLLLRRTQQQYPGDFWVNLSLGYALSRSISGGGVIRTSQWEKGTVVSEVVAFSRVALGLRPDNVMAHNTLGAALFKQGDLKGAVACYHKALDLDPNLVEAHTNLGAALALQGNHPGAVACFRKALEIDPRFTGLHYNLGRALYEQGDLKGALACYTRALKLDPRDAKVQSEVGTVLFVQGDVKGAIACYKKALKLDPKYALGHFNLGNALAAQHDLPGAIDHYQKALNLDPKSAEAHDRLGNALYEQGDFKGALASYTKAIGLDPKLASAHLGRGAMLCDHKRDYDGAIACFQKALDLDPKNARAHFNLGNALNGKGKLSEAIASYRKACGLDPEFAPAHVSLGNALNTQGDVDGAIASYRKALEIDPKLAPVHGNLGVLLCDAKRDYDGAIAAFQKSLGLDPKKALVHYNLGNALREKGKLSEAVASYRKALDLGPRFAPAHYNLGQTLKAQGDSAGAIACYRKALDLDPKNASAYLNLGILLYDVKREYDGAIAAFQKFLELDPRKALAHNNLGNALLGKGKLTEAIAAYRKSLALDPTYAPAYFSFGLALYRQGDLKGAIARYKEGLEVDPKDARTHFSLGVALYDMGDLAGAVASYRKALDLAPNYAEAHCNLGLVLRDQGKLVAALDSLKRGHALGSSRPGWSYSSHEWVEACERLVALDARLTAILQGKTTAKDAAEQLALADLCQRYKKRHVAAVRFYQDAFAAQPKLAEKLHDWARYNAACAAALAGCGKGKDGDQLKAKERAGLRQQALDWLRADLVVWSKQLEDADAKTRKAVHQTLQHWQKDADLAGVRGEEALAKLPEAERAAWQQFWAEVETLRQKAAAANSP
jgi:tetratricopeptide (TPR) repeat protein/tRNA A-37 threonylcarbamoyl transferase component Bud32